MTKRLPVVAMHVITRRACCVLLSLTVWASGCVSYRPTPIEDVPFRDRAQTQVIDGLQVTVAVPSSPEARDLFGVDLYKKGVQPVWVEIRNDSAMPYYLSQTAMDPDYYPPGEVAYMSRFRTTGRLVRYGLLTVLVLPLVVVTAPVALVEAWRASRANAELAEKLGDQRFLPPEILPGTTASGFVFTTHDPGTKLVRVVLFGPSESKRLEFVVSVPGVHVDHAGFDFDQRHAGADVRDYEDPAEFAEALAALPCCTTRANGEDEGDPMNLVVIGSFDEVLTGFTDAGWDETESLDLGSAMRTAVSGLFGSPYRVSPVSDLFAMGSKQDVAFQKIRDSVHQRHHFRLWSVPMRFRGEPVWIGAASRDIGVYFTWRAWNLMTHAIDPDVDDARSYLVEDLYRVDRLEATGLVGGVGAADRKEPRRNLMQAPWYSDGYRAVMRVRKTETHPVLLDWTGR